MISKNKSPHSSQVSRSFTDWEFHIGEHSMLVISRKIHQGLVFKCPTGELIKVYLGEQNEFGQYAIKIDAPRSVLVLRDEAYIKRTQANEYPWEDDRSKKMNL